MSTVTTEAIVTTSFKAEIGTMSPELFGSISVNNFGYHYYEDHIDMLGLTNVRFPGGTVSETGYVDDGRIRMGGGEISLDTLEGDRSNFAFDLTHPELISPLALQYDEYTFLARDDVGTFSQALALAVDNGVSLGLIIPVQRYFNDVDFSDSEVRERAIAAAVSDITTFLERLKNGEYNDGEYPEPIIFEIGNEAYENPIEYAVIAKAMIDEIAVQLVDSGIDYEIAVQIGRGSYEFNNLLDDGYFDPFFDGSQDMIPGLDDLDFVPGPGMSYPDRQIAIDELMTNVLGDSMIHIDAIRHHLLGFSSDDISNPDSPILERDAIVDYWMAEFEELGVAPEDVAYYVSAWSTNSSNGNSLPYELSAAANTLELFAYFMEAGVDQAAVWGVVGSFRFKDNMLTTVITDRLSDFVSPQGAILQLMTSNIIDSNYLGSGGSEAEGYVSYTYESDTAYTIFFVVGVLGGEEFEVEVDLGIFGDLDTVTVTNLDIVDGAFNGASELTINDQPVVDGMLDLTFDQDFEIVMITLEKEESTEYGLTEFIEQFIGGEAIRGVDSETIVGNDASETIIGGAGADIVMGQAGDDILDGGAGRGGVFSSGTTEAAFDQVGGNNGDFIFGGEGNDIIRGNSGNDLLSGDQGDDHLWGGGGFDTFVFTEGQDEIHDFKSGVDTILLDASLLDGIPIHVWLEDNSTVSDGATIIDFGGGNELTVHGVIELSKLMGDVEIHHSDALLL